MIEKCSTIMIETEKQHNFRGILHNIDHHGISIQCSSIPITSSLYINKSVRLHFELLCKHFSIFAKVQSITRTDHLIIRFNYVDSNDKLIKTLGGLK